MYFKHEESGTGPAFARIFLDALAGGDARALRVRGEQYGRLALYLVITFGITWVCWWPLAFLIPSGAGVFTNATFSALYIVGGLGPTLSALLAVALTPREGSLATYGTSLTRWRVPREWYLVAFLLPAVLAFTLELLAAWFGAQPLFFPAFHDLSTLAAHLLDHDSRWRPGRARLARRRAAHARAAFAPRAERRPSSASPGRCGMCRSSSFTALRNTGPNFPLFAADVMGNAFLLAWIYGGTGSILVCVLFHAASNTSATMGLGAWDGSPQMAWIGPAVKIALGVALILWLPRFRRPRPPSP